MIPLLEYEQIVHVDKDTELTKSAIRNALYDAQRHRRYAKFYCGKYYISIAFNRDETVQFSSNYRVDTKFRRELDKIEGYKYRLNAVTNFIHYWMNKFRRL